MQKEGERYLRRPSCGGRLHLERRSSCTSDNR